jgi:hypothetical protein
MEEVGLAKRGGGRLAVVYLPSVRCVWAVVDWLGGTGCEGEGQVDFGAGAGCVLLALVELSWIGGVAFSARASHGWTWWRWRVATLSCCAGSCCAGLWSGGMAEEG